MFAATGHIISMNKFLDILALFIVVTVFIVAITAVTIATKGIVIIVGLIVWAFNRTAES